jgi:hypothetical protein
MCVLLNDTRYNMVVLVSITLTALLVMLYPTPFAHRFYSRAMDKPLPSEAQGS